MKNEWTCNDDVKMQGSKMQSAALHPKIQRWHDGIKSCGLLFSVSETTSTNLSVFGLGYCSNSGSVYIRLEFIHALWGWGEFLCCGLLEQEVKE